MMNAQLKERWVTALESGEYPQGQVDIMKDL